MIAWLAWWALATQDGQVPSASPATEIEDVVVTARRAESAPFDVFKAMCLDPARLEGRAFSPGANSQWAPATSASPPTTGELTQAFSRRVGELHMTLLIREGPAADLDRVKRHQCSLLLSGPHDQRALEVGMNTAMGASGTRRHLRYASIFPTRAGWTQLAWTAIPDRRSGNWRAFKSGPHNESGFVVILEPFFYRRNSYVVTEVQHTSSARGLVSQLTMTLLTRNPD